MYSILSPFRFGVVLALSSCCVIVMAQPRQAPGETTVSVGVTGLSQFNTRIVDSGSFNWQDASLNVNVTRQITSEFSAGASARYNYQNWSWSDLNAFGGRAPWTSINTPGLGLNFGYSPSPQCRIGFAPTV